MKILNLFAGIGGNRSAWGDNHEITAVEINPDIASIYQKRFPNDIVIVGDAFEFLLQHYNEYDFIWISPPCQSHSIMLRFPKQPKKLPDLRMYSLIIFLQQNYSGKYVVENVKPYYEPLIKATTEINRHLFWSNFAIPEIKLKKAYNKNFKYLDVPTLCKVHNIDETVYAKLKIIKWPNHDAKRQILRNCVDYRIGKYILKCATKTVQTVLFKKETGVMFE